MMAEGARKPKRIQRRRVRGWRMPEGAVYVGRPSVWGNDFTSNDWGSAADKFRHDVAKFQVFHPDDFERWIALLRGKDLACWCPLDAECHADVLLELAAEDPSDG